MKLETLTACVVKDSLVFFPEFILSLEKGGVRIRAKSPVFAEFLAQERASKGSTTRDLSNIWRGFPIAYVPAGSLRNFIYPTMTLWGHGDEGPVPNLIWLFHKDLATGIDLTIAHPIALNDLQNYFATTCDLLQEIYVTQIRTPELSAVLREIIEHA